MLILLLWALQTKSNIISFIKWKDRSHDSSRVYKKYLATPHAEKGTVQTTRKSASRLKKERKVVSSPRRKHRDHAIFKFLTVKDEGIKKLQTNPRSSNIKSRQRNNRSKFVKLPSTSHLPPPPLPLSHLRHGPNNYKDAKP